jgi:hypothetical protein
MKETRQDKIRKVARQNQDKGVDRSKKLSDKEKDKTRQEERHDTTR